MRWARSTSIPIEVSAQARANKTPGDDRDAYLAKRSEYLAGGASFIEINLLRGGKQSPMGKPLPPKSDYSVVVSQAAEFPRGRHLADRDLLAIDTLAVDSCAAGRGGKAA